MAKAMAVGLEKLRGGGDFREFVQATAADFDRMSASIHRRWKLPPGVDTEDVRQQLYIAFVEDDLVGKWDPSKGKSLQEFAIWNAYSEAKRWLHDQRAANRRDGKSPSRFPICFSALGEADNDTAERGLEGRVDATQEEVVAENQLAEGFRCLLGSQRVRMAFDVLRLCGGHQESAVHLIASDPSIGMRCEVGSYEEAKELVRTTVQTTRALVREVLRPADKGESK